MLAALKRWARGVKRDAIALFLAARDPRTPWYAKALAVCVAGYALSPIDLIPDFIPLLGYLDDMVLVPLRRAAPWIGKMEGSPLTTDSDASHDSLHARADSDGRQQSTGLRRGELDELCE